MPNAVDLPRNRNAKKLLVYGPSGSGKTTQFLTLPGKKFLFIFDPAARESIAGHDVDYELFLPETLPTGLSTLKGDRDPKSRGRRYEPLVYPRFEAFLQYFCATAIDNYDAIGFDSLSNFTAIIMDRLTYLEGREDRVPELQDYNIVGVVCMRVLRMLLARPDKLIYITAHSDLVQDELTKRVENQLDTYKNIRRELPKSLSEILISQAVTDSTGNTAYYLTLAPNREWPMAKTSIRNWGSKIDVTIDFNEPLLGQGLGAIISSLSEE